MQRNMARVRGTINEHAERYQKSIVEPFHPETTGVRVPAKFNKQTVVYNDHKSVSINATQFLAYHNMEVCGVGDFGITTDATIINEIVNTNVTEETVYAEDLGQN